MSAGVQKGSESEEKLGEEVGSAVFGWFKGLGNDLELAVGRVNESPGPPPRRGPVCDCEAEETPPNAAV